MKATRHPFVLRAETGRETFPRPAARRPEPTHFPGASLR